MGRGALGGRSARPATAEGRSVDAERSRPSVVPANVCGCAPRTFDGMAFCSAFIPGVCVWWKRILEGLHVLREGFYAQRAPSRPPGGRNGEDGRVRGEGAGVGAG